MVVTLNAARGYPIMAKANPLEQADIVEIICQYLDGQSLIQAPRVCSAWKQAVQHVSTTTDIWQRCCEMEIGEDALLDIKNNLYPSQASEVDWSRVYACWYQWKDIRQWPFTVRELMCVDTVTEQVTCMKISGTCIITGHLNGTIIVWDCFKSYLGTIGAHRKKINDLGLICVPDKGRPAGNMWNVRHDYVISTSDDHLIKVTQLSIHATTLAVITLHKAPTLAIAVSQSSFVVVSDDHDLSVWELQAADGDTGGLHIVFRGQLYPETPQSVSFWKGRITGVTKSNLFFYVNLVEASGVEYLENVAPLCPQRHTILDVFMWRTWTCVWITATHTFLTSIDLERSREYNCMVDVKSYPVCALLYGEMLLLGMESGAVYMYLLRTQQDMVDLDMKCWAWSHSVCWEPIVSLAVADSQGEIVVAAATREAVYCISLYQPGTT